MSDDQQAPPRSGNGASLSTILTVATLFSLAAGVGYNFRQVNEIKEWQEKYDKEYVRRDVQEQELKSINYQLTELRNQLSDLKVLVGQRSKRD